jgi:hypothetical protein
MAMSLKEIEKLMKKKKLKYFVDPDRPVLMLSAKGLFGTYQILVVLEREGEFLQFRTAGYRHCTSDSPHLEEVLKALGSINYRMRYAKFGWNPANGEIVVFADTWLMDEKISWKQFERMLDNYFPAIDLNFGRLKKIIETGKDPGEKRIGELPQALDELVKKLKEKKSKEPLEEKKKRYV